MRGSALAYVSYTVAVGVVVLTFSIGRGFLDRIEHICEKAAIKACQAGQLAFLPAARNQSAATNHADHYQSMASEICDWLTRDQLHALGTGRSGSGLDIKRHWIKTLMSEEELEQARACSWSLVSQSQISEAID